MSGTYHYQYASVVWNEDDFSDLHILKNKVAFGLFQYPILFETEKQAIDYATSKGFKNCKTVSLFHTKM